MTDMFLERTFEPPLVPEAVVAMSVDAADCFLMHRVDWLGSLLSADGRRMLCWFRSPDAESTRTALRQSGADAAVLWAGTVHTPPAPPAPDPAATQVVVARRFDEPVTVESIQAIEDAGAWCLEAHRVQFVRTFFSRDRQRMLCVYQAPDAESVRLAQAQAGMPVEAVWPCRYVHMHLEALPAA